MATSPNGPPLLTPLVETDGEKHAEFKRRRDEFIYTKVPLGGEAPYLADQWIVAKTLKRQVRLAKTKNLSRKFEDRVWRLFYRMGFEHLNKGHDFVIRYKAADKSIREKQVVYSPRTPRPLSSANVNAATSTNHAAYQRILLNLLVYENNFPTQYELITDPLLNPKFSGSTTSKKLFREHYSMSLTRI
jgi:hypothetical protein